MDALHDDPRLALAALRFHEITRVLTAQPDVPDAAQRDALQEMLNVIAEQNEWRFFVDAAHNLGHQGSTVMLARRLIDLTGFAGRALFVFAEPADHRRERTARKLALMFGGLDPTRIEEETASYRSCRDIRFLEFSHRCRLREPAAFGFCGGADDMAFNYAAELKVRFLLRLQPYRWDDLASKRSHACYQSSRIEQPDGRHLYLVDAWPPFRELSIDMGDLPPVDDALWQWFTNVQQFDPALGGRTRNLRALIDAAGCAESRPLLWPVYGLQHLRDGGAKVLLMCVMAASRLQAVLRRPIVIASFSPNDEIRGWDQLLQPLENDLHNRRGEMTELRLALRHLQRQDKHAPSSADMDAFVAMLADRLRPEPDSCVRLKLHRGHGSSAGVKDISRQLAAELSDAQCGGVHVVMIGTVPMDLFNDMLARAGLPAIVEGQASVNLLRCLDRPCLQIVRSALAFGPGALPGIDVSRGDETINLRELPAVLRDLDTAGSDPAAYWNALDHVTAFVSRCAADLSEPMPSRGTVGIRRPVHSLDKLSIGLLALRELVLAETAVA